MAVVIYLMVFTGGFFEKWGLNHALTLRHYVTAFGVALENGRLLWTGRRVELVHDDADDCARQCAADRRVRTHASRTSSTGSSSPASARSSSRRC